MSGHSKWSTIKRKKGVTDAKRGKIFTRCISEITVAVKQGGGGDPDANPRLRLAIDKAKSANMPGTNIERAIKRATGEDGASDQIEVRYEGYGPGGAAIMVDTVTDNKNRTVGEVRHAFSKHGGNLGESGCVSYLFSQKGMIVFSKTLMGEDEIMELALNNEAEDIKAEGDFWEVTINPDNFFTLKQEIESSIEGELDFAEVQFIPATKLELDEAGLESVQKLLDKLEELDDVIDVFTNVDLGESAQD